MVEFEYVVKKASRPHQTAFSTLKLNVVPSVYEPHEDSFLLADAAKKHAHGSVLDLGCGTGIAGLCASQNKSVTDLTFADASDDALALAEKNAEQNHLKKPRYFVKTDLFSAFAKIHCKTFDTIAFNPPYLPTTTDQKLADPENAAYDGGKDGRNVLDRFLKQFPPHLAEGGVLLLLNSSVSANDGQSGNYITQKKLEKMGFKVEIVGQQAFFFEKLVVFKAKKD